MTTDSTHKPGEAPELTHPFPVIRVPDDAGEATEAMGSKPKFWYYDAMLGRCLYKQARAGTGEDWAEKVAAELAELLSLPHARVELATWRDTRGTVSPSFVPRGDELIHGNEILLAVVPGYPGSRPGSRNFYRVPQHTLEVVLSILATGLIAPPRGWTLPAGVTSAVGVFVGYLLLDAWIGNTDRHHENWAFIGHLAEPPATERYESHLAPTYDHASSLGRNEPDERRRQRLTRKDPRYSVEAYVEKATSAFYDKADDSKPLATFDAFAKAARRDSGAAKAWLDRLAGLETGVIHSVFERLPDDRISEAGVAFAQEILVLNRQRLVDLRGALP
jgi:hypothetical protein